jgi:hypothetical protein
MKESKKVTDSKPNIKGVSRELKKMEGQDKLEFILNKAQDYTQAITQKQAIVKKFKDI